jgi:hypothetical protein
MSRVISNAAVFRVSIPGIRLARQARKGAMAMAFEKQKLMGLLAAADKNFNAPSAPLRGLLRVLDEKALSADRVQAELDAIGVGAARGFAAGLKYVVDEVAGTCYTGVAAFQPVLDRTCWFHGVGVETTPRNPHAGSYTSPTFRVAATVFCIAPAAKRFEVGFIQHCRSKEEESRYSDGSAQGTFYDLAFPMGDSTNETDVPFYIRGTAFRCSKPCWVDLRDLAGKEFDLQFLDVFWHNMFHWLAVDINQRYVEDTHAVRYFRKQSFTTWLARRDASTNKEHLLRQVDYEIDLDFNWDAVKDPPWGTQMLKTVLGLDGQPAMDLKGTSLKVVNPPLAPRKSVMVGRMPAGKQRVRLPGTQKFVDFARTESAPP